jgi:NTE family protein
MKTYYILLVLVLYSIQGVSQETSNVSVNNLPKKVLVVSGGGARGAWGAGVAKALSQKSNYVCVVGTSTGSLMAPLVILRKFDSLETAYTTQSQGDIFNVNPFKPNGTIRPFNALWRLIIGKRTLGESKNLKKLINKYVPLEDFNAIKAQGKTVIVNVVNMTTDSLESKSSDDYKHSDFKNWIWASGNEPVFMSLYQKNTRDKDGNRIKNFYVDGGIRRVIPLQEGVAYAIKNHIRDIDVIINAPLKDTTNADCIKPHYPTTILGSIQQTIDITLSEVKIENIKIGLDSARFGANDEIRVRVISMPVDLYCKGQNELIFDKVIMREFWDRGYKEWLNLPETTDAPACTSTTRIITKSGTGKKADIIK